MSAGEPRHEGAPKNIDERVISEELLSWMQRPESEESVAPVQKRVRDTNRPPEMTSDVAPEGDDTRDRLLSAISDTEIAKGIRGLMQADPQGGTFDNPPRRMIPSSGAEAHPFARVVQTGHATRPATAPAHRYIVQASPVGTSKPLMPPASAQQGHPRLPELDSIIEEEKTRDRLLRAISEAGPPGGEIPASNPHLRFVVQTSPQAAPAPLMPAIAATPHRRTPAPRTTEVVPRDAVPQALIPPEPMAVAEAAPAVSVPHPAPSGEDRSPKTEMRAWDSGGIRRLNAKLAWNAKRMGEALWGISVRSKNRVMAQMSQTVEGTSLATTQLSIEFRGWMKTKAHPAMEHLVPSLRQLSVRFWPLTEAKTALTRESRDTTGLQLSIGVGDCAQATQSAPEKESMSQDRPRPPTRLQKWFGPRRSSRLAEPPVVAYCWTADTPHPIKIADISGGGVRLLTDAPWPRGGVLSMTLQRTDRKSETPESWVVIDFMVLRLCSDGIAGAFIPSTHRLSRFIPSHAENCADERTLKRFVRRLAVPEVA